MEQKSGSEDNQRKSQSSFFKKLAVISTFPIYSKFVDLLEKIENKEEEIKDLKERLDSQNRLHGEATTKEKKLKKEVEELEEIHRQHPDWENLPELIEYFKTPEMLEARIRQWTTLNQKRIDLKSAKIETSSLEIKVKTINASLRTANDELSNDKKECEKVVKSMSDEFEKQFPSFRLNVIKSSTSGGCVVSKKLDTDGDAQMDKSVTGEVLSMGSSSLATDQTPIDQTAETRGQSNLEPQG
ncbi:hypothetical protein B9Z55_007511 [Caenorhabditis nigoni]|uniref:Uncharacterized protein n=1 Tax=Caenorhabditis nigoni TaxID=1611254 RepID=A0A2G5VAM1_9PELO|nr:hypothetical protein B9Z55_007511 [Caenorhabditis nigoni]